MYKKLFTPQNLIMAFGVPYGIFLNYSFFKQVVKDRKQFQSQIRDKI